MFYQEVTIAETPEDGDTRNSCIGCGLDIDIAITDVDDGTHGDRSCGLRAKGYG